MTNEILKIKISYQIFGHIRFYRINISSGGNMKWMCFVFGFWPWWSDHFVVTAWLCQFFQQLHLRHSTVHIQLATCRRLETAQISKKKFFHFIKTCPVFFYDAEF